MACVLAVECAPITMIRHPWLQARDLSFSAIFFFVALLYFGREKLSRDTESVPPIDRPWIGLHFASLAFFFAINLYLLRWTPDSSNLERLGLIAWYSALTLIPVSLGQAMFGFFHSLRLFRKLGVAWGIAAICVILMAISRYCLLAAWESHTSPLGLFMQKESYLAVQTSLGLFFSKVSADPTPYVVGTRSFEVEIGSTCSGIEGLTLISSLTVGWLIRSRRELRLARAVWLVPVALALVWILNIIRIVALIAIGDAGYPDIAVGGFHSEAGAILFSCVALLFLYAVNRISWFLQPASLEFESDGLHRPASITDKDQRTNVASVYLLPFLAILSTGLLARAASDGFEWLYPIRILAALAVFVTYRRQYAKMNWHFSALGPLAGLIVAALWICFASWIPHVRDATETSSNGIAAGLSHLTVEWRIVWLVVRTISAIIAVPIAEELAFRGYLARRLVSITPEAVPFRNLTILSILVSSGIFSVLHGRMWFAALLAGLIFALAAKLSGRLGEAVAAHATANAIITAWVLVRGDYGLW